MDALTLLLAVAAAAALGALAAWVVRERALARLREERGRLQADVARLETTIEKEREGAAEKLAVLDDAERKLSDAFKALSAEALRNSGDDFLRLAKTALEAYQQEARGDLELRQQAIDQLVLPLKDSLQRVDQRIQEIETARATAYGSLTEHLQTLASSQSRLERETANLVTALRKPMVRGRWGELQLQRVVEMAGMVERCDFVQQPSSAGDEGRMRPDMVIRLPGGKSIVVDSKAPLEAYLDALEAPDEEARRAKLQEHARQVRAHLRKLGEKGYWTRFQPAPELVVLFLPGESFYSAALEQDPTLMEFDLKQGVVLATPMTLIALLRAVAYGWRQEQVEENARAISDLGRQLYERLRTLTGHFVGLGRALDRARESYNQAVGSLETRVLPAARRFKDLGAATGEEIELLDGLDKMPRQLSMDESDETALAADSTDEPHS